MRKAWLLLDARTAGYCHDNLCVTRIAKEREDFCSKASKQRTMLQASPVTSIRPCKLIHLALSRRWNCAGSLILISKVRPVGTNATK